MKKSLNLGLILVSSLFLSACTTQNPSNNNSANNEAKNETKTEETSSFSLRKLIAQNIPQKCTYSGTNQDGSFTSEIIISGKKFNQIITVKSNNSEEKINSISDGQYVYTWGNHSTGGTFAIKLKADFDKQATPSVNQDKTTTDKVAESQVDLDTDYQGKCTPTTVSDSNFQPPKDIKFQDYTEMMDQIQKMMPSGVKIPEQ